MKYSTQLINIENLRNEFFISSTTNRDVRFVGLFNQLVEYLKYLKFQKVNIKISNVKNNLSLDLHTEGNICIGISADPSGVTHLTLMRNGDVLDDWCGDLRGLPKKINEIFKNYEIDR